MRMIVASLIVAFSAVMAAPAQATTTTGSICTLRATPDSVPDMADLDTQFTLPRFCRPR